MYTMQPFLLMLLCIMQILFNGCSSAPDKLQREYAGDSRTLRYGEAFSFGFQNGAWSEIKDANGGTVVQFKGTISTGLHDFSLRSLAKSGDRSTFLSACVYLGNLVKTGKMAGNQDISFNIADYPITKQGDIDSVAMEKFLSSPDNNQKIRLLNSFYINQCWAEGSSCIIQWKYSGKGAPKVVKIFNKHWDNDPVYMNNPDTVVQMVFDYAMSVSN